MDSLSTPAVGAASQAPAGSTQSSAAMLVLRKALDMESANAVQLIEALPQPPLARSGTVGTMVNTYA